MDSVQRRKAESQSYDQQKQMQLQDDEINRLNSELRTVLAHLVRVSDHFQQKKSVCRAQISRLKQEIAIVAPPASPKKARMVSDHTKAVAQLQSDHRSTLDKIKSECDLRLTPGEPSAQQAAPQNDLIDSTNSTRSQISDELEQKAERQEIQRQERSCHTQTFFCPNKAGRVGLRQGGM
jgi:hypothetical protein